MKTLTIQFKVRYKSMGQVESQALSSKTALSHDTNAACTLRIEEN